MTTAQLVADERNFRPKKLDDFIGQADVKKTLSLRLSSAQKRGSVRRGPGPYPVMFEAIQTGPCTLTDGDFSVQNLIKQPSPLECASVRIARGILVTLDQTGVKDENLYFAAAGHQCERSKQPPPPSAPPPNPTTERLVTLKNFRVGFGGGRAGVLE